MYERDRVLKEIGRPSAPNPRQARREATPQLWYKPHMASAASAVVLIGVCIAFITLRQLQLDGLQAVDRMAGLANIEIVQLRPDATRGSDPDVTLPAGTALALVLSLFEAPPAGTTLSLEMWTITPEARLIHRVDGLVPIEEGAVAVQLAAQAAQPGLYELRLLGLEKDLPTYSLLLEEPEGAQ